MKVTLNQKKYYNNQLPRQVVKTPCYKSKPDTISFSGLNSSEGENLAKILKYKFVPEDSFASDIFFFNELSKMKDEEFRIYTPSGAIAYKNDVFDDYQLEHFFEGNVPLFREERNLTVHNMYSFIHRGASRIFNYAFGNRTVEKFSSFTTFLSEDINATDNFIYPMDRAIDQNIEKLEETAYKQRLKGGAAFLRSEIKDEIERRFYMPKFLDRFAITRDEYHIDPSVKTKYI